MSENTDKRTATQKIEDLEKVATVLYQALTELQKNVKTLLGLQNDMVLVRDALKILNKKTEAIIQSATPETGVTIKSVSDLITKMNVEELTEQVAGYVANGHLVAADEVAANSYLVCEEYDADGTLVNPRIQFRLDSQDQTTADAMKGKKAGDLVSFGENKFSAKVIEVYSIAEPKAAEAAPAPAAAPEAVASSATTEVAATADAAPAEAASTTNALNEAPVESPVPVFVPSDASTMMTAS